MASIGTGEIRSKFSIDGLEKYLRNYKNLKGTTCGSSMPDFQLPLQIQQFKFGQSNPTYYIRDASSFEFVLRRKPVSNAKLVSKSAHAIEREFFMLRAIDICNKKMDKKVPIPQVYLLCEDENHIGSIFYIMQYIGGRQFVNPNLPGFSEEEKKKYWDSVLDTCSSIHSIDFSTLVRELPASHFPQYQPERISKIRGSYFDRQIRTLSSIAEKQNNFVDPIPHFGEICSWLASNAPKDPFKKTLIHGDFKIDNLIFDAEKPQVVSVLDWELCTIGHPIFDLSNLLQPFQFPNDLNIHMFKTDGDFGSNDKNALQFITNCLETYYKKLGSPWDPSDPKNNPRTNYKCGAVFGLLRLCVISQGIKMRTIQGNASSGQASTFGELYPLLSSLAQSLILDSSSKL